MSAASDTLTEFVRAHTCYSLQTPVDDELAPSPAVAASRRPDRGVARPAREPLTPNRPVRSRCDVCGFEGVRVRRVERSELRPTVATWIKSLCPKCVARLAP